MYIIIIGCGRTGSAAAKKLSEYPNDVVVIDNCGKNFEKLGSSFNGKCIKGIEYDTDVLNDAGITEADVFLAMTPDDNINIMACKIAKDIYGVKKVISRVSNLNMKCIYEGLGIEVVSTIELTINSITDSIFGAKVMKE